MISSDASVTGAQTSIAWCRLRAVKVGNSSGLNKSPVATPIRYAAGRQVRVRDAGVHALDTHIERVHGSALTDGDPDGACMLGLEVREVCVAEPFGEITAVEDDGAVGVTDEVADQGFRSALGEVPEPPQGPADPQEGSVDG